MAFGPDTFIPWGREADRMLAADRARAGALDFFDKLNPKVFAKP